jgi:RNA polymerase-binding transcription factor DksA
MIDTNQVRTELEKRLKALNARVDEIEGDLRSAPSADFEEQAIEVEGDEVLQGLESSALTEIMQIQAALKRIAEGSYAECMSCGEEIGEKRLLALPYAARCIECAERQGA